MLVQKRTGLALASSCTAAMAFLMSTSALAQTAPAAPAATPVKVADADDKAAPVLEEIVVTADRKGYGAELTQVGSFRGAKLIDTPMTINVIPQALLVSQQVQGLADALKNTAGVSSSQTTTITYSGQSIRGIPLDNRNGYRLNGSLPIVNLIDLAIEDKDRVEVLKGASALYYGFVSPSGIINMTMKRPTEDLLIETTAYGDSNGGVGGHVDFGDTWGMFGARVNLAVQDVDSGIKYTAGNRSLMAGAFDFKPTDDFTFSVDGEHMEKTVVEPGIFRFTTLPVSTAANPYPKITIPALLDPASNFGPDWATYSASESNILMHANYRISDAWAATADYGISDLSRHRNFSTLNPTNLVTGAGTLSVSQQNSHYENRNARAEIAGTFDTGPIRHELLVGYNENVRDAFAPASNTTTFAQNFLDPVVIPRLPDFAPPASTPTTRIDDEGAYLFDRMSWEWFQLVGGIRRSDYRESTILPAPAVTTFYDTPISYSGSVIVKPVDWVSAYASYIDGLETTPGAPTTAVNAGQQLPATHSTQREVGLKVEPYRGLLLQTTFFSIKRGSAYTNAANVYVLDGRAKFQGEEINLTGEVTPQLSVYLSALFLSAKQVEGAPTIITVAKGKTTVTPTVVGMDIDNTPKVSYSLSAEYKLDDYVPGLAVSAGAYYTGARAINPLNQAFISGYWLVDLGASYNTGELLRQPLTFRVNAENVAGTRYWAATDANLLAEGPPMDVKFSVSTKF